MEASMADMPNEDPEASTVELDPPELPGLGPTAGSDLPPVGHAVFEESRVETIATRTALTQLAIRIKVSQNDVPWRYGLHACRLGDKGRIARVRCVKTPSRLCANRLSWYVG